MTTRTALYAGSFDPPTNGHLAVLRASLAVADTVLAAIGIHPGKTPLFSFDERVSMIRHSAIDEFGGDAARIDVVSFDGLVVEAARAHGATVMIRGLRDGADLDYEMRMAGMNATMAPEVQTIFIPARSAVRPVTATLVRQIAAMGGDVTAFVPAGVAAALHAKFAKH